MPCFENDEKAWKRTLRKVFVCVQHLVLWTGISLHVYNTITRSYRYLPELFQSIFEDFVVLPVLIIAGHISWNKQKQVRFVELTETSFRVKNEKALEKCNYQSKLVFAFLACAISVSAVALVLESVVPLSA